MIKSIIFAFELMQCLGKSRNVIYSHGLILMCSSILHTRLFHLYRSMHKDPGARENKLSINGQGGRESEMKLMGDILDKANQQMEYQRHKGARKLGKETQTAQRKDRLAAQFLEHDHRLREEDRVQ